MWWQIGLAILTIVLAAALYRPPPGPKARTIKDLSVPKSEEGEAIYDGAGTFWIDDPHVVWYGDFSSKAIYKKGGKK